MTLPLFVLIILLLIVGVLIGGAAAWLRQRQVAPTARRLEREVVDLRQRSMRSRGRAGEPIMVHRRGLLRSASG